MPNPTINDVAELAGVSIKTVSRVVNAEPNVRESTRNKVNSAIAKLNYRPNQSARNLASLQSHLIALIYDDPTQYAIASSGFAARMQQGTLRACRSANYELLIHPCIYRNKTVGQELRALIEQVRPAGIVLAAPLSNMSRIVRAIEATGAPFVLLAPGTESERHFSVGTNDREICAELTRYLASLGHRRIAFIKGHPDHRAVGNRYLGYQDGLRQSGLALTESLVADGDSSYGSGEARAIELLGLEQPPSAIFAANDDMAAGVIRAASKRGIKVPEQLSVSGFDDMSFAQQIYPTLTTIRQPIAAMAERAALTMIDRSRKSPPLRGSVILPAKIQVRESTGPAPHQDY